MGRIQGRSAPRVALAVVAGIIVGAVLFGSFGEPGEQLGVGQRRVSAQPSATIQGTGGTISVAGTGALPESTSYTPPTPEQVALRRAGSNASRAAMAARARRLPASDPRGNPASLMPVNVGPFTGRQVQPNAPGPLADGDVAVFENFVLDSAGNGLPSSEVNEPAVAQNGKYVFETWNWGAARSTTGGNSWTYIDPAAGMADFCCDQDVIYDKGRDRFYWLRMGIGFFPSPIGGTENRHVLTVDNGAAGLCLYDIRPSVLGIPALANTWFDFPRMSLSNDYLYIQSNVFSSPLATASFVTHVLLRLRLSDMANCASAGFNAWNLPEVAIDGWTPALVENARETMFLGDTIITNGGLNTGFRVYWVFDDSTVLNFVNRTIAAYAFTSGDAVCTVPGGNNPCARSDSRVTGGVIAHNSPLPAGLGASGDRVDFYWNSKAHSSFPLPFVDSATFHAGTLNYGARKLLAYTNLTPWYAAVAANDRDHVGLTAMGFYPAASGVHPQVLFAIDDNYNTVPAPWELYSFGGALQWTQNASGDYLRARKHAPGGVAWVISNFARSPGQYTPSYIAFGRARDLNGFNRFDQQ
jgi:hypothetical protein